MLSQIADSLFWLNRYVERADGILRMLRINFITSLDKSGGQAFSWESVLQIFTPLAQTEREVMRYDTNAVLKYMITDADNQNSIKNIIARAREDARGVQDHITKEAWESINALYHIVNNLDIDNMIDNDQQIIILSDIINRCMLFYGVLEATMPRGRGWHYMNIGKFIERTVQTADILDVKFGTIDYDLNNPSDIPYWRNLLLSVSGYELYLKTYRTGVQTQNVIDMLVLNLEFPRSILYSLSRLHQQLSMLKNEAVPSKMQPLDRMLGRVRSRVEYSDISSISKVGLHEYLSEIRADVYHFSTALGQTFFAYS